MELLPGSGNHLVNFEDREQNDILEDFAEDFEFFENEIKEAIQWDNSIEALMSF